VDTQEEQAKWLEDILHYLLRGISPEDRKKFQAGLERLEKFPEVPPDLREEIRALFERKKQADDDLMNRLRGLFG